MKTTLNSRLLTLMLGLMLMLVACEKSDLKLDTITSQEVDKISNTTLDIDQTISFLEKMGIDVNSMPSTAVDLRGNNNLVEASYFMPGFNTAEASNGETFEIDGNGDLTLHPKSVCGSGAWVHRDANGVEIASGGWEAEKLMTFLDYGPSPAEGWEDFQFIHAGKSIMRIHLGEPADVDAILTIYCILPEVQTPPSWPEGIKINIQQGGPNFNQVVIGGTFFTIPNLAGCD